MPWNSRTFWLERRGNSPAEYEDASAANDETGRYAVADGASESCFARLWASLLVEGFVHSGHADAERWITSLFDLQKRWDADVMGQKLPWYAEPGVEQGAFATFLGLRLTVHPDGPSQWQAIAVGDTCLFHTRGTDLLRAFPLEYSMQFGNSPKLVGSRMSAEDVSRRLSLWPDGQSQPGDRLWTMTDALAQCCLAEYEAGGNPWGEMESLLGVHEDGDEFALWIEGHRNVGRLHNDDVTLLAIRL